MKVLFARRKNPLRSRIYAYTCRCEVYEYEGCALRVLCRNIEVCVCVVCCVLLCVYLCVLRVLLCVCLCVVFFCVCTCVCCVLLCVYLCVVLCVCTCVCCVFFCVCVYAFLFDCMCVCIFVNVGFSCFPHCSFPVLTLSQCSFHFCPS